MFTSVAYVTKVNRKTQKQGFRRSKSRVLYDFIVVIKCLLHDFTDSSTFLCVIICSLIASHFQLMSLLYFHLYEPTHLKIWNVIITINATSCFVVVVVVVILVLKHCSQQQSSLFSFDVPNQATTGPVTSNCNTLLTHKKKTLVVVVVA